VRKVEIAAFDLALVLGALILIGSGRVEAQASPAAQSGFSDANLRGTYVSWTTFKAYVKFAGGPRIASGEIQFDGRGGLSGHGTYFNETLELSGTYVVRPDGTGSASYGATNSAGHTDRVDLDFQIVSRDKVKFQSSGWENRDWSSVEGQMQSNRAGLVGEWLRKPD
jgi:hypothetical protein